MRKLICFPFAGAGASFFRPLGRALGDALPMLAVQLPGREHRFAEPPFARVEQAVSELLAEITAFLMDASEVTLFGHSLGAVLAYELARRLEAMPSGTGCRLVVSGSPAPHRPRERRASGLSDDEFLDQVSTLAGYRHEALEDPEMRELLLPMLRADVELHELYRPEGPLRLHMPVTCLRGRDDTLVSAQDIEAWQEVARRPIVAREVEGGHMYLADGFAPLIELLTSDAALAA